jgi:transposase-like protein
MSKGQNVSPIAGTTYDPGMSFADIAKVLGVSRAQVWFDYVNAIKKIQRNRVLRMQVVETLRFIESERKR